MALTSSYDVRGQKCMFLYSIIVHKTTLENNESRLNDGFISLNMIIMYIDTMEKEIKEKRFKQIVKIHSYLEKSTETRRNSCYLLFATNQ